MTIFVVSDCADNGGDILLAVYDNEQAARDHLARILEAEPCFVGEIRKGIVASVALVEVRDLHERSSTNRNRGTYYTLKQWDAETLEDTLSKDPDKPR